MSLSLKNLVAMVLVMLFATGCASMGEKDPYEKFNRQVFTFNDAIDRNALKPAATTYKAVMPEVAQIGVSNFFGNLSDVWTGANNLLQGKAVNGLSDFGRVLVNSTVGIAGLFEVASKAGLPKHDEDFGQTLGYWGVPSGPYLMLPLLGPSTLRDASALPIDMKADPWAMGASGNVKLAGSLLRVVDHRAGLLEASELVDAAALDRYEFIRDGFLQRRLSKVSDGAMSSSPTGVE
jgi:phospholipid-binding lipoprotein MlaA